MKWQSIEPGCNTIRASPAAAGGAVPRAKMNPLQFAERRLEESFTTSRLSNSQLVSSAAHNITAFCWSWAPVKLLVVASRGCKWSPAVLVVSVLAQILNVLANGWSAWAITAQGKKTGRSSEFPRLAPLYFGLITTFAVRTLLGNEDFKSIFSFPGTFTAAALQSATAITDHLRLSSALPFFLATFALGLPFEVPQDANGRADASLLAAFFAVAVVLPSAVVVVLEAKERREFLVSMGQSRRLEAPLTPSWVRSAVAAVASLARSVLQSLARLSACVSRAFKVLQFPDGRLESMFNTWKLQQHQSLSSASHAMAGVCWACGSLKFLTSTLRDGRYSPAVLAFIYFLEAVNVCFNFFVSWDITREGQRTEKRSEKSRMLCVLVGTLTNAAVMATIGAEHFQTVFGFPGTFTTAALHSCVIMIDQVRLSSALPLFLVSFASVAPFEAMPDASAWAVAHRLLLFFFLSVVIPSTVAILLEARERHLFVEFHEEVKARRLLSPFWWRVVYGVDSIYYAMHSMTTETGY